MPRHKATSAPGCKQTATRMERRDRTAANATNGLLSRQFANITEALFKASQRRNTELQELQQRRMGPEPTPPTSRSVAELPVTAEPKLPPASSSGNSRVELEQVYQSNKGMARDELTMAASTTGLSDMGEMPVHLRGGYMPDDIDDPKMMLAELNMSKQQRSGSGAKQELDDDYDLAQMLARVKKVSWPSKDTTVMCNNDPKVMFADLGMDAEDELSALAKRLGIDSDENEVFGNPETMLADLDDKKQASGTGHSEDEDDDLETLRDKLATMFALSCDTNSPDVCYTAKDMHVVDTPQTPRQDVTATLEPERVPNPDMKEHVAKKEREEMVKRGNEKLDATIKFVLEEEERYRAMEKKKGLPTRLIVSNLAASVDEEAIRIFFAKYKRDIRNVSILPERDPVKRTRTAHADMYSREKAVHASYQVGSIYGLIVKIKLARE